MKHNITVTIICAINFFAGVTMAQTAVNPNNVMPHVTQIDTAVAASQIIIDGRKVNVDSKGIQSLALPEDKKAIKPTETKLPE